MKDAPFRVGDKVRGKRGRGYVGPHTVKDIWFYHRDGHWLVTFEGEDPRYSHNADNFELAERKEVELTR